MLFNSWQFVLFFPTVVFLYFSLPHRYRWALLLGASYFFYMSWEPAYLLLILTSTVVDYFASLGIAKTSSRYKRKGFLILSLCANLGLLFSFKYFNFFSESLRFLFQYLPFSYNIPALNFLLPVGISFYTFQTLSYTIEVYRGNQEPEKHFGYFALYVSYFPQLVAGPIERPMNLLPQLRSKHDFDYNRVTEGLGLIVWGLFKKVVIADRLALIVDNVYAQPDRFTGVGLSIATVFFAFQIYCDFSGYTDIAIGCAQVMGHRLMRNFNRPYFATSIAEFWKRWHISLTTWFRDYLYIPLGGNRVKISRFYFNIIVVFVISGLWHGANWTFILWGLYHGLYYIIGKSTNSYRQTVAKISGLSRYPRFHHIVKIVITFVLVCFGWIIFRANNFSDVVTIISRLGTGWASVLNMSEFKMVLSSFNVAEDEFWLGLLLIGLLISIQFLHGPKRVTEFFAQWNWPIRRLAYVLLVLMIFNFGVAQKIPFIYFQF